MTLVELVYTSEIAADVTSEDIHHMIEQARIKNRRHGVSGLLVCAPPYFIQLIEGKSDEVIETFSRIQQDRRHHAVHILHVGPIARRSFPQWDMGLMETSGDWQLDLRQFEQVIRRGDGIVSRGVEAIEHFYHQSSVVPV